LVHYGDTDQFVSRNCKTGGAFFEQDVTNFVIAVLEATAAVNKNGRSDVWFLDAGANVGVHSVAVAASDFPVVAIEATPATAERLRCSKRLNRLPHFFIINVALDKEAGTPVCMFFRDQNHGANSVKDASDSSCLDENSVFTARLDDIFNSTSPYFPDPFYARFQEGPTVFKMDIEGSEGRALEGYTIFGSRHRPVVVLIELVQGYLSQRGSDLKTELLRFSDAGYDLWRGDFKVQYNRNILESVVSTNNEWGGVPGADCGHLIVGIRRGYTLPNHIKPPTSC